jgi:sugar lactone lactonase YvrE
MTTLESFEPLPFIDGIVFGEGPRWHDGRLWFTDGPTGKVYSAGETGDLTVEVELERASGLGWLPDGTLVVSTLFEAKVHHVDAQGTWQPRMTSARSRGRRTTSSSPPMAAPTSTCTRQKVVSAW